jgi:hypothetical protein
MRARHTGPFGLMARGGVLLWGGISMARRFNRFFSVDRTARERNRRAFLEQLEDRSCPAASISISASALSITEGGSQMVMVQAMGSFTGEIVVNYATSPGTATSGNDYTPRSGSVTLTPMMSMASIMLDALTDAQTESPETYDLALLSLVGDGALGSPSSTNITILDSAPPGGGGCGTPTGISVASPGTLNEGQNFNLHVTLSPPCNYMISGSTNWGTSPGMGSESFSTYAMSDGQFWLPHQYWDDGTSPGNGTPSDNETITVTVGSLVGTTSATITNIAPTGNSFHLTDQSTIGGPTWRLEGFIQDVTPFNDILSVAIDWGDGSTPTVLTGLPATSSVNKEHTYPMIADTFTVQVTVTDDDTGQWTWSGEVSTVAIDVVGPSFIFANDDDDDDNDMVDTFDSEVENDDELRPVSVVIHNPAGIDLTDYYVQFETTGSVDLWLSQKADRVLSLMQFPAGAMTLFVQGTSEGSGEITAKLVKNSMMRALGKHTIDVGRVRIRNNGVELGFTPTTVWVGDRMNLEIAGANVTDVQWFGLTEADTFKHWGQEDGGAPSNSYAQEYELTAEDKDQREIAFHWVVNGMKNVSANVNYIDPVTGVATAVMRRAEFDVKRPNASLASSTTAINPYDSAGEKQVVFGDKLNDEEGITFIRVNDPQAGGTYQWVQLTDHSMRIVQWNPEGQPVEYVRITAGFVLDNPYPYGQAVGSLAWDSPSNTVQSPAGSITSLLRQDQFRMFLLWKPDTPGAQYVPLKVVAWEWGFLLDAGSPGGTWTLIGPYHSVNPPSQNTYEVPEWTSKVADYPLVESL